MAAASNFQYTVGGTLRQNAPSYIVRQADDDLYNSVLAGEYCYVFNSRQMGKSSLRVQVTKRLQSTGIACAVVDVSSIVSAGISEDGWYLGLIRRLSRSLGLKGDILKWWRNLEGLSPLQRFSEFLEDILLVKISQNIVIFIDEIDSLFPFGFNDDFFALIREFYNRKSDQLEFKRLTFVLFGVSTPSALITDPTRTPFNIGKAIQLTGFTLQEMQPLAAGLEHLRVPPQAILGAVRYWTMGQPFLTQKLCQMIAEKGHEIPSTKVVNYVAKLVHVYVIDNWLQQDVPEHFKTIQDRLLKSSQNHHLLSAYAEVLRSRLIESDSTPEQIELRLSGLVISIDHRLHVANRIYLEIFTERWIEQQKRNICPYSEQLERWIHSQEKVWLLRGSKLKSAREWARQRTLPEGHHRFLMASQDRERNLTLTMAHSSQEQFERAKVRNQKITSKTLYIKQFLGFALILLCLVLGALALREIRLRQNKDLPSWINWAPSQPGL